LPIKPGYRPYKQPPRKIYKDEILADMKKEAERLIADMQSGSLILFLFTRKTER
jgi:hypothetical protein